MARQQTTRWLLGALLFLTAASTAHAETIDLAAYFPNAQMATTHVLKSAPTEGVQGDWDLRPMLADGNYNVFYGHASDGTRDLIQKDIYAVTASSICLVANVLNDGSTINMLLPYPCLPRMLDLSKLPIVTETVAYPVHHAVDGTTTILEAGASPVVVTRDGDMIRLHWGDDKNYETMFIGETPIEGTHFTAPGMRRYKTSLQGGIDTWFTWVAR